MVTGATGAAGTATTRAWQAPGATVVAVGHSAARLSALADAQPGVFAEVADLSEHAAAGPLAPRVRERHGSVEGVIHLVGGYRGGASFAGNTDEDWRLFALMLGVGVDPWATRRG